ncbi:hypothetical protein EUGRSUZ_F02932 [Eucalyptus grandis]|uniref:Uncharacterized protein n=2 Tax=Eucalyptus grandis TaxID=71139 RepID=A0ACC3KJQ9_EUCGR|nr:hypothetical protein EUGRSUZ_F02932 [Eucalyptus grandis]
MDDLPKCETNHVPLTPLTFLKRAASAYADRTSVVYESARFTWRQTHERCLRLASSLRSLDVVKNDVVSILAPNVPAMYEMHFAVPMVGAVLNTINARLNAANIATILHHSSAKVFFVDCMYVLVAREALAMLSAAGYCIPMVIDINDINSPTGVQIGDLEYEDLIQKGDLAYVPEELRDEWDPIALNYTSGTTSEPKGVVCSHRGAYLSTLSLILGWEMRSEPVVTNICCAPVIFNILLDAKPHERREVVGPIEILTSGAPPPQALILKMESLGFHITHASYLTHAYGLTEATGPALVCEWRADWNRLPPSKQARLKARQGISVLTLADVDVKDLDTMRSVPRDGKSMGEIVLRGSSIMKGYYKNPEATAKAFRNRWFLTGDVGVVHRDGYVEVKDRSKDVIISGGENISSVELENVLYGHPRVLEAAVVAMPHPRWGESPCAFISIKKNSEGETDDVKEAEILSFCRKNLPSFMVPKKVEFMPELPKTSTGKIQKFRLRALAKTMVLSEDVSAASPRLSRL